jgi:ABC-type transport system involved in cytochrome c biogenesis permease subunit
MAFYGAFKKAHILLKMNFLNQNFFKKISLASVFAYGALLLALVFSGYHFLPKASQGIGVESSRELPLQHQGRIKPLDTLARTALLAFSGKSTLKQADKPAIEAATWLLILATQPLVADAFEVFRIDHPEVKSIFQLEPHQKHFSYNDLSPKFEEFLPVYESLNPKDTTVFAKAVQSLYNNLQFYHELVHSFRPFAVNAADTISEYVAWQSIVPQAFSEIQKKSRGESADEVLLDRFFGFSDRYLKLAKAPLLTLFPPQAGEGSWSNIGQVLLDVLQTGAIPPVAWGYATLAEASEKRDGALFQKGLNLLNEGLEGITPAWRLKLEVLFNQWALFYQSAALYILAGILVVFGWMWSWNHFKQPIHWIFFLAMTLHTSGILVRMLLQGRPPVTSLYASALFVGWAAVFLSWIFERFAKNGLGLAVGGLVGGSTLIVAHHLSAGEDTLEMVRAVLDSNFWLSTHVIAITLGYSAMFLAGGIAFVATFRRLGPKNEERNRFEASALRMVYAAVCFGLLFSFIGTLLGGIWADQSWGRFWGWDPKENGALLIVLWGAFTLHARMGGLIRERGMLVCALLGNVITSWSWFGTNMLGVGLHSYGFMEAAFWALLAFIAIQGLAIGVVFVKK